MILLKKMLLDISPVGVIDLGDDIFSDEEGKTYPGEFACSSSADSFTLNPVVNIENISSSNWSDSGTGSITSGEDTLTPTYTPYLWRVRRYFIYPDCHWN